MCLLGVLGACRPFAENAEAPSDAAPPPADVVAPARATILVDDPTSTTVAQLHGTKTSLYWIAGGARLKRTEKSGGGITTVLEAKTFGPHGGGIPSIATNDTAVFAIVYGLGVDPFCRNMMAFDGAERDLGYGCGQATAVSVHERFVYFGSSSAIADDVLYEVDSSSGKERILTLGAEDPIAETCAAAGRVYLSNGSSIRVTGQTTFDTTTPFAQDFGTLSSLACDAEGVVWATKSGRLLAQAHGASAPIVIASGLDDPHAIVLAEGQIFFATAADERAQHFVRAVPRAGGTERSVWRATDRIDSFVVDADAIFVATAPRTIFRVDR